MGRGTRPYLRGDMGRPVDRKVGVFARADVSGRSPTDNLLSGKPGLRMPVPLGRAVRTAPVRKRPACTRRGQGNRI